MSNLVATLAVQLLHSQEHALRSLPILRVPLGVPVDELGDDVAERRRRRLGRARIAFSVCAEGNVAQNALGALTSVCERNDRICAELDTTHAAFDTRGEIPDLSTFGRHTNMQARQKGIAHLVSLALCRR